MAVLHADPEMLQAALVGYHQQRSEIDAKIAEIRSKLEGHSVVAPSGPAPAEPAPRRVLSAAARHRIAAAQKKRWAAFQKAKAAAAKPVEVEKPKKPVKVAARTAAAPKRGRKVAATKAPAPRAAKRKPAAKSAPKAVATSPAQAPAGEQTAAIQG